MERLIRMIKAVGNEIATNAFPNNEFVFHFEEKRNHERNSVSEIFFDTKKIVFYIDEFFHFLESHGLNYDHKNTLLVSQIFMAHEINHALDNELISRQELINHYETLFSNSDSIGEKNNILTEIERLVFVRENIGWIGINNHVIYDVPRELIETIQSFCMESYRMNFKNRKEILFS